MNYNEMLLFVQKVLVDNNAIKPNNPAHQFRDRYEHSKRVYGWAKKIVLDCPKCDKDVLFTACIFHDIGYSKGKMNHAQSSADLFREYALNNNFPIDFTNKVADIIAKHSDKTLIKDPSSPIELVLLLEADLLDEEGAIGIVWDLMAAGYNRIDSYSDSLDMLYIHSGHILNQDYMVTPLAKKYWDEKKELVRTFINELKKDLFVE